MHGTLKSPSFDMVNHKGWGLKRMKECVCVVNESGRRRFECLNGENE